MNRLLAGISPGLYVNLDWRPTANFSVVQNREVRGIIIHEAECGEIATAAENLAEWDRGPGRPRASWHCAVDCDSMTQSVAFEHVSWHANAVNPFTIGIEHAGYSSQTAAQWQEPYSSVMLEKSAQLVAILCELYQIPVRRRSLQDLSDGYKAGDYPRGIQGHCDISRAIGGTQTDPGPNFPWDRYLARVAELATHAPQ